MIHEDQYEYDLVVYLRCIDQGTPNECWIVCAKGDPRSIAFVPLDDVEAKTPDH